MMNWKSTANMLKEEEWYRIYSTPTHSRIYESKFVTGDAKISLHELRTRWKEWHHGERVQFAKAFGHKRNLAGDDEQLLDFLMEQDGEEVSASIALLSTMHSDRKRAAGFLSHGVRAFPKSRRNFLRALSVLSNLETAPVLLMVYEECCANVANDEHDYESLADLLYCSAALFKLHHEGRYRDEISRYLRHPDESIRTHAQLCLEELS